MKNATPPFTDPQILDSRAFLLSWRALEELISENPYWQKYGRAWRLRYIADAITRQRLAVAGRKVKTFQKVRLSSRVLKAALGDHYYRDALNYMLKNRLIESDHRYRKGKECMGYAPTASAWESGIQPVPMDDSEIAKYEKVYARLRGASDKRHNATGVPIDYLRRHLDRLAFFPGEAERILQETYQSVTSWQTAERFHGYAFSASHIASHDWSFSRCEAGRLHYPITSLPKTLRRALRYDGDPLIEIDVGACQPLLASSFIPREEAGERARYLALATSGRFYDHFAEAAGLIEGRAEAKRLFMKVFFGGEAIATKSPLWPCFESTFPALASELLRRKRTVSIGSEQARWQTGDRETALELQRQESRIFIGGVLRRVAEEHPDKVALPIHDGVLTIAESADKIEELIRGEFKAAFGIVPSLSRK